MNNGPKTLIDLVRRNTWHKTVLDQNTLPTFEAICFRSRRTSLVLHTVSSALNGMGQMVDITEWGWFIDEKALPTPILDTDENMKKVDLLLARRQAATPAARGG